MTNDNPIPPAPGPLSYAKLPRTLVAVTGSDRREFLQGLISQDIDRVNHTRAAYGTLLTPQGKYLHDFFLVESGDTILADCESTRADDLVVRLSRYRLRADVALDTEADLSVVAVFGEAANAAFDLPADSGRCTRINDTIAFVDPRTQCLGVRLIGPHDSVMRALSDRRIPEVPFDLYDQLRISCAAPDGSRDMEVEKSTLLESNIDLLNGIDWEKGCYIGQELTARTRYRGLVKRRLAAMLATNDEQVPGVPILWQDKAAGEIRSRCGDHILASVRVEYIENPELELQAAGHPIERPGS